MKKLLFIFPIVMTILSSRAFSQTESLKIFLDAYKTYEFDESKKIVKAYSFGDDVDKVMSEYSSINGLLFDTDIPELKGYKAILNCKMENKAHKFVDERMMVIMYFDKEKNNWAVFSIRDPADPTHEYSVLKSDVEKGKFYTAKEYVYRSLAYWSMMAGKLQDAKKYNELSILEAKSKNNSLFTTNISSALNSIL